MLGNCIGRNHRETTMDAVQAFDEAVNVAIAMARGNDDGFLKKVAEIDALFVSAQGTEAQKTIGEKIRGPIFDKLRHDPALLGKFGFASGLVNLPVSPFFRAVMEAFTECEDLTVGELLAIVATFRRSETYEEMHRFAGVLYRKIASGEEPAVWNMRSKLSYELHMAAYQQAGKANTPASRNRLLQRSMSFARKSASEAEKAGDAAGKLHALMNISGLLYPALGKFVEGAALSKEVCDQAEELSQKTTDADARDRVLRIAMNTYFHRIGIAVKNAGNVNDVQRLLTRLDANSIYRACNDQEWARKAVEEAREYIRSKK